MSEFLRVLFSISFVLLLQGCFTSGEDELRQWMVELRANTRPHVAPLKEPKQFKPETYALDGLLEPFNAVRLTQALRKDSMKASASAALVAPEMNRRKEPLEAYPLDAMVMVGSLNKSGLPTALLKIDNLLYQVRVGGYLGQSYGRITSITENAIVLREIVQDATGDWVERQTTLDLQEGKK